MLCQNLTNRDFSWGHMCCIAIVHALHISRIARESYMRHSSELIGKIELLVGTMAWMLKSVRKEVHISF
jgi:hypothetical protein